MSTYPTELSLLPALPSRRILPVVLDANAILQDVRQMAAADEPSVVIKGSVERSMRLLATGSVVAEVERRLPRLAADRLTTEILRDVFKERYGPHLWVVDVAPDPSDPEVQQVMALDPDDAPSMTLARMVAPSLLFSWNLRHLPLAIKSWRNATYQVRSLARAEIIIEGGQTAMGLSVVAPIGAIVGLVKGLRKLPVPLALAIGGALVAGALAYVRSEMRKAHWERLRPGLMDVLENMADQMNEAWRAQQEATSLLAGQRIPQPPNLTTTHRVAHLLAINPWRSATELIEAIAGSEKRLWTATSLKEEVLVPSSMFVTQQRRWALGRLLEEHSEM